MMDGNAAVTPRELILDGCDALTRARDIKHVLHETKKFPYVLYYKIQSSCCSISFLGWILVIFPQKT